MTARPRPPHNRTGGFRKGGEQSQSCGVRHRPHSITPPPPSAEAPRCQVRRPSEQAGKGARRGVEERKRRHRTAVDSAQTKFTYGDLVTTFTSSRSGVSKLFIPRATYREKYEGPGHSRRGCVLRDSCKSITLPFI
ncbi:unnamed protein product [Pleuronectes platessa]|uniref:Uncharacterized protein n=1 Tax=Pleuronectes platessa TaxID=8262 RepID=A0A9N7U2T8_PLEPL|nr:unnamed protein product [Pleuronectes platessa]